MSANNTSIRIIVAIIAIPLILAVCYFGEIYFLIFATSIALLAFHEYAGMLEKKAIKVSKTVGFISVLVLLLNSYFSYLETEIIFFAISLLVLLSGLPWKGDSPIADMGGTILGIMYVGLLSSALVLIREFYNDIPGMYLNGGLLIIAVMATIWVCDSAAFFLGVAFGKHKLYPKVSPKKSWEGGIAGFVFSILAMIALHYSFLDFLNFETAIIMGIVIGLFGQAGDFIESLFKRDSGVKDSSALIPGHGGIMDRFDSLIYSAPLIYIILTIFEK